MRGKVSLSPLARQAKAKKPKPRIHIHVDPLVDALIRRAARKRGVTRAFFIVHSAHAAAIDELNKGAAA